MRTTIEISPEHRARLLELAARRGERGISGLIAEALDVYFASSEERTRAALAAGGSVSDEDAAELRSVTQALRSGW